MTSATNSEAGRGARVHPAGGVPAPSAVTLEIPCPPSVNEMFRNVRGKGRVKTRAYVDWLGYAGWELRRQRPASVPGRVLILLSVERGSATADIDNRVKAIFDLLVTHGAIEDDRFVVGFAVAWAPPANRLARVLILPAADLVAEFHLSAEGSTGGWFCRPLTNDKDEQHALSA